MIVSQKSFLKPLYLVVSVLLCAVLYTALHSVSASAATQFITTWKTDQQTAGNNTISIPTASSSDYNYFVDWGDGLTDSGVTGNITHTYAQPGTYTVSISGQFPRIFFNNGLEAKKILSVDNWGSTAWESMVNAFEGCSNLQINALDTPNLSQVNSLSGMFRYASSMNSPINNWDLGSATSIANMFEGATSFNQDIGGWNTQNVEMFAYAFKRASNFNQNINSWNMSKALSTNGMFSFASSFNQPVNSWDMSSVKDMRDMFANATSFNQDVSTWDTNNAQRVESVFRNAVRFEQDISSWTYSNITNADYIFNGSRMTGPNYDQLLLSLAESNLQRDVVFDAGTSNYCFAGQARQQLIDTLNWQFIDNGQDTTSCGDTDIRFTEGLAATVNENEPADTVVGELVTVHPGGSSTFSYSFCSIDTTDAAYFRLSGAQLLSNRSFDFENPVDANLDNVYELCIISTDTTTGFSLQRLLTVAVIDQVDPNNTGSNTDNNGQTLSDSTDQSNENGEVLAATDENDNTTAGSVLAATGIAIVSLSVIGVGIALAASFTHRKTVLNRTDLK